MIKFLEGKQIYLSPITKEDISEEYINWLNDKDICKDNAHATFPNNRVKALEYVESVEKSKETLAFTIRCNDTDEHIGNVALQAIDSVNRSAEIAIIIGNKNYWGKGIGFEAYQLLIDHGFTALNLNRISSGQTVRNAAMVRICEKVGMKKEGVLRQALYRHGEYLDIVVYSILREEYQNLHN